MKFVISIDKIGSKVEVRGLAIGDENIYRFEKKIADVAQSRSLPIRITLTEEGEEDRSDLAAKLGKAFASDDAITCKCASLALPALKLTVRSCAS